ncbi:hypothetical protein BX666DRAFT_604998 [Dichotomocladium elegans]|nr:hypothetical protein BX666DRAFT_604998 [Dichotomocladium elegans]
MGVGRGVVQLKWGWAEVSFSSSGGGPRCRSAHFEWAKVSFSSNGGGPRWRSAYFEWAEVAFCNSTSTVVRVLTKSV